MLNPNDADAEVVLTVYFEEREPDVLAPLVVGARRVRCIRTSDPIDGAGSVSSQAWRPATVQAA